MRYLAFLPFFLFTLNSRSSAQDLYSDFEWKQSPVTATWVALSPRAYTWYEAAVQAERLGGQLLTVDSQAQSDWLKAEFLTPFPMDYAGGGAREWLTGWVGLNDLATEGAYEWWDGTPLSTFSDWVPISGNPGGNPDYDVAVYYERLPSLSAAWLEWPADGPKVRAFFELPFDPIMDMDGDGLLDADEDWNHNGIFEPAAGETNPQGVIPDSSVLAPRVAFASQALSLTIHGARPGAYWIPMGSISGSARTEVLPGTYVSLTPPLYQAGIRMVRGEGSAAARFRELPPTLLGVRIWLDGITIDTSVFPFQVEETPAASFIVRPDPLN